MNNAANIIASFPAYDVERRATRTGLYYKCAYREDITFTNISTQDRLGLEKDASRGSYYKEFSAGSVVSYAMHNNEDPIEAIETSKARNEKLHWINACGSSIVSHQRAKWTLIEVHIGMIVMFEGILFTVEADFNDNLKLVPYIVE